MGMLVEGLNLIRDEWNTLHDAVEAGTGTTQETGQDTDLEVVAANSESTDITSTTADQFVKKEGRISGVFAAGQTITEVIWKTKSPELAGSRITIPALTWNTSSDIVITSRWHFRGCRE